MFVTNVSLRECYLPFFSLGTHGANNWERWIKNFPVLQVTYFRLINQISRLGVIASVILTLTMILQDLEIILYSIK